jgi:hypothetical protein
VLLKALRLVRLAGGVAGLKGVCWGAIPSVDALSKLASGITLYGDEIAEMLPLRLTMGGVKGMSGLVEPLLRASTPGSMAGSTLEVRLCVCMCVCVCESAPPSPDTDPHLKPIASCTSVDDEPRLIRSAGSGESWDVDPRLKVSSCGSCAKGL